MDITWSISKELPNLDNWSYWWLKTQPLQDKPILYIINQPDMSPWTWRNPLALLRVPVFWLIFYHNWKRGHQTKNYLIVWNYAKYQHFIWFLKVLGLKKVGSVQEEKLSNSSNKSVKVVKTYTPRWFLTKSSKTQTMLFREGKNRLIYKPFSCWFCWFYFTILVILGSSWNFFCSLKLLINLRGRHNTHKRTLNLVQYSDLLRDDNLGRAVKDCIIIVWLK